MDYAQSLSTGFSSEYYPGEAVLALVRLYSVDPDEKWLDAAEKAARYLIQVRDGGIPPAAQIHDHWLLYALNELHRLRPDEMYVAHSRRIAEAILRAQIPPGGVPDWGGGYGTPPRSTPAATRNEGLCAAYRLERDFGEPERAARVLEGIRLGTAFALQTQCLPESALYLPNPRAALGGFRRSLTDYSIRMDYVQHNLSALLNYREILMAQAPGGED